MDPHDHGAARDLIHRWWCDYDEGRLDRLEPLLAEDVHSSSRTDTGDHPHEEFIRSDQHGASDAFAWTRDHRRHSPYPLRHNQLNLHVVAERNDEIDLEGYLMVTRITDGRPVLLSTGISRWTLRMTDGSYRILGKHTVLDSAESVEFHESPLVADREKSWTRRSTQ